MVTLARLPHVTTSSGNAVAPYIKTRTGRKFSYLCPSPDQVAIEDIAHALGNICRFNGHTRQFFSVAQHSVETATYAMGLAPDDIKFEVGFACLMHDAHEAYIGDFPTPLKDVLGHKFREIEAPVVAAIYEHFDIAELMDLYTPQIHQADRVMLFSDAVRWGMDGSITLDGVEYTNQREWIPEDFQPFNANAQAFSPGEASAAFLDTFNYLNGWR